MSIKKLLTAMALLLPLAAMAQTLHWTAPGSTAYPDETPVWVQLNINGEAATAKTKVELAAFIDNSCRADVTTPIQEVDGKDWYLLRVRGNNNTAGDLGKNIVFRAYYKSVEYEFTATSVTFTGDTYTPAPLVLNLDAVTGVSLPEKIEVNKYLAEFPYVLENLEQYITFQYQPLGGGSYTPLNESKVQTIFSYTWSTTAPATGVSISGNSLTIEQSYAADEPKFNLTVNWYKNGMTAGLSGSASTTVEVTIAQVPVSSITCDISSTQINAFEDFASFMAPHIKVEPTDASIKTYHFEGAGAALVGNEFQAGGQYNITIVPDDPQYAGTTPQVTVTVFVLPSNISANKATIDVNYGDNVFTAIEQNQTLTWPKDADPGDYGKRTVSYAGLNGHVDTEGKAIKLGTIEVTVTLVDGITVVPTFQGQNSYTVTVNINSQLTVTAEPTDNTTYKKNGTVSTTSPVYVYVSNPGNEPFSSDDLKITFDPRYSSTTANFPYAVQSSVVYEGKDEKKGDIYSFRIQPQFVGIAPYSVTYLGQPLINGNITISKEETLAEGWTWMSLATNGGNVNDLFTQADLVEIRSQEDLLWNDPTYGYVGTLTILNETSAMYKVKTNKETTVNWGSSAIMKEGETETLDKPIVQGFNWVNYPYEFDLDLTRIHELFTADGPAEGDRIITQDGFITFSDNEWKGSSTFALREGMGFMYYRSDVEGISIKFPYALMPTASNPTAGVKRFVQRTAADDVLSYDVHAFADNMSMIAEINGLENPEDYTLGAFVNDECRGRGRVAANGKMFVSAVGKSGEYMSFKLVNNTTGAIMPVDGVVSFTQIQGSLNAPVKLTMPIATGINQTGESLQPTESYDLSGRQIQGSQRGISIQRMSDGSVRKVVKK